MQILMKQDLPLDVSLELLTLCQQHIDKNDVSPKSDIYVCFNDPHFSPYKGGYLPVDFDFDKNGYLNSIVVYQYINHDPIPDLVERFDLNFDWGCLACRGKTRSLDYISIEFLIWQTLFLRSVKRGVYEITIAEVTDYVEAE